MASPPYALTAHIDLVSRYVLRGATSTYDNSARLSNAGADAPESSKGAVQWGVDWVHESGRSLGYWASTVNYSYRQLGRSYVGVRQSHLEPAVGCDKDAVHVT